MSTADGVGAKLHLYKTVGTAHSKNQSINQSVSYDLNNNKTLTTLQLLAMTVNKNKTLSTLQLLVMTVNKDKMLTLQVSWAKMSTDCHPPSVLSGCSGALKSINAPINQSMN